MAARYRQAAFPHNSAMQQSFRLSIQMLRECARITEVYSEITEVYSEITEVYSEIQA